MSASPPALVSIFAGIEAARSWTLADTVGRAPSWTHASPSQIKRARECLSSWFLESVLRMRQPDTAATKRGHATHAELEAYLIEGRAPGPIGAAGLAFLPVPPYPRELVEVPFSLLDPELEVPIVGKIDLLEAEGPTDHKTLSGFEYVRSEDELRADPQAVIYALASAPSFASIVTGRPVPEAPVYTSPAREGREPESYPGVRLDLDAADLVPGGLRFRHVYYRTRAPKSKTAEVWLSGAELRAAYEGIRDTVRTMQRTAKITTIGDVPFDLSACGKYQGCAFRGLCAELGRRSLGSASSAFSGLSSTTKGSAPMSLLEALAKRRAEAPSSSPAPASTAPSTPAPAAPPKVDPFALPAAPSTPAPAPASPAPDPITVAATAPPTINPPDGLPHGAPLPAVEESKSAPAGDIVPADLAVSAEYRGARLASVRKEAMGPLFAELRALVNAADRELPDNFPPHIWHTPDAALSGIKRVTLRDCCESLIGVLVGKPVPFVRSGSTSAEPASTPAPAAHVATIPEPAPRPSPPASTPAPVPEAPSTPPAAAKAPEAAPPAPVSSPEPELPASAFEPGVIERRPKADAPSYTGGRMLFVDCVPRNLPVVYASTLLAPLCEAAAEELKVVHYRVPQYKRGEDNVIARLSLGIRDGSIELPAALVIETRLPLGAAALEVLSPLYPYQVDRIG